jgi:hypothetical protein
LQKNFIPFRERGKNPIYDYTLHPLAATIALLIILLIKAFTNNNNAQQQRIESIEAKLDASPSAMRRNKIPCKKTYSALSKHCAAIYTTP